MNILFLSPPTALADDEQNGHEKLSLPIASSPPKNAPTKPSGTSIIPEAAIRMVDSRKANSSIPAEKVAKNIGPIAHSLTQSLNEGTIIFIAER